jgi:MFS transporter, PAT family, beta-lactamase induction signal transducer AmpG
MNKANAFFKQFCQPNLRAIFVLGISQGLPWVIMGSAMSAWLQELSLSRSSIGLFGLVFAFYSFNFIWSPFVEKLRLPILSKRMGIKKSWIFMMQLIMAGACLAISAIGPAASLFLTASLMVAIGICASTHDIAIDGYRIDILDQANTEEVTQGSVMITAGWWTGYAGIGSLVFFMADWQGWGFVYAFQAACLVLFALSTLFAPEPSDNCEPIELLPAAAQGSLLVSWLLWFLQTLTSPVIEFFKRNGVRLSLNLLLFLLLFKLGEAYLGKMSIVFYKEIGFSNSEIGAFSKLMTWGITIGFAVFGGAMLNKHGSVKGLIVAGIAMASSNLLFAVIAEVGPERWLFATVVFVDSFTQAWSSVCFVAFLSLLTNKAFSASQYAMMASIATFGRTLIGSTGGIIVDYLDGNWSLFFVLTTLMVIPSLILLWHLRHDIEALDQKRRL